MKIGIFALLASTCLIACPPNKSGEELCKEQARECGWVGYRPLTFVCGQCGDGKTCDNSGKCVDAVCTPFCPAFFQCGDDMCGGTCGTCPAEAPICSDHKCVAACKGDCTGKTCGDDGCGGSCGTCSGTADVCKADFSCAPKDWRCSGKSYGGGDFCDCDCGAADPDCASVDAILVGCMSNESCDSAGLCAQRVPNGWTCNLSRYGDGVACDCECGVVDPDCSNNALPLLGCSPGVSTCGGDAHCGTCAPDCAGRNCGGDGCGGSCGPSGVVSTTGPASPDGMGGCQPGGLCIAGICTNPCPSPGQPLMCERNECGNDGCGGSCGTCNTGAGEVCTRGLCMVPKPTPAPDSCMGVGCGNRAPSGCFCDARCVQRGDCCADQANACCVPQCNGKSCGSDGCGGDCGVCGAHRFCASDNTCAPDAPSGLVYLYPAATYAQGQPIPYNIPSSVGGAITTFSSAPPLPTGLVFATGSGLIYGTPLAPSAATVYTITGSNVTGTTTANLTLTVLPAPPSGLTYSQNPATYRVGTAITPNAPSLAVGSATSFDALPALPPGLVLATGSGIITGTPAAVTGPNQYTITASNTSGSTSAQLQISVLPMAPSGLAYATPVVYTVGVPIPDNTPTSTGGPITNYVIAPAAPSGLLLDPATGVLSGTPTLATAAADYAVTGSSVSGSTVSIIRITVNPPAAGAWSPQAFVKAFNNHTANTFGRAVAIAGDLAVVGAPFESSSQAFVSNGPGGPTDTGATSAGAAYVYRRSGTSWTQEAYLKAGNAAAFDFFGYSVAADGNTIVVGAIGQQSAATGALNTPTGPTDVVLSSGAAYVFFRNGATWEQQAMLKSNNPQASGQFGWDVAVHGSSVAVGANAEYGNDGRVYTFTASGATWSSEAELLTGNGAVAAALGSAVDLDGNTLVVGAVGEVNEQGGVTNGPTGTVGTPGFTQTDAGAAYVYLRGASGWTQQAYLKSPVPTALDTYGSAVAISANTIVVGAPNYTSNGAAFVYTRGGVLWTQQAQLLAPNGQGGDRFGGSVALDGNRAAVGAADEASASQAILPGATGDTDTSAASAGAVYAFSRSGSAWTQSAYLKASNAATLYRFGACVDISASTLLVGSPGEASHQTVIGVTGPTDNSEPLSGAGYVFLFQ